MLVTPKNYWWNFNLDNNFVKMCLYKACSYKIRRTQRKIPVPESLFNKWVKAFNLKKRLWDKYFPVIFTKFLRKSFFIKHLQWLPLVTSESKNWVMSFELSGNLRHMNLIRNFQEYIWNAWDYWWVRDWLIKVKILTAGLEKKAIKLFVEKLISLHFVNLYFNLLVSVVR